MERSIVRLATALLAGLLVVAGALGYWQVVQANALMARSNNPRLIEEEARIARGRIVDRNGVMLASNGDRGAAATRAWRTPMTATCAGRAPETRWGACATSYCIAGRSGRT